LDGDDRRLMKGRIDLRQDVRVLDVANGDRWLSVVLADLRGRRSRLRFEFDDDTGVSDHLTVVRRWMHRSTLLTHVRSGATSALVDDRARFEAAYGANDYL